MLRLTITNIGRAPMTGTARIAIDGAGDAVAIPALGSLGSTVLRLQIPPGLATGDSARPEVTLRVEYGAESIGQTIRPMVHPMESVMEADFEGPVFNWSLDGWGLEELPGRGRVMGDSPGGLYRQGTGENILRWMAPISLHDLDAAELRLDARWVILARDHEGSIEARRGSNAPWEKLDAEYLQLPYVEPGTLRTRMRGDLEEWNRLKVDLDRFVGEEIELRFVMTAEQGELDTTFDGIMLDNIAIVGTRSPSAHVAHPDARTRPAIHLYPNPFADHLELYLENTSADAKLTLVDALGRIVRRAQGARASFDTRDLPAGFYTAMASTRRGVLQQKVMLGR
jgi:hypothetical protein